LFYSHLIDGIVKNNKHENHHTVHRLL